MADIDKLHGIKQQNATALKNGGIVTVNDLWKSVGADPNQGIKQVSKDAKVGESSLIAILIAEGLDQTKILNPATHNRPLWERLRYHLSKISVPLALILCVIVLTYDISQLLRLRPALAKQLVVKAPVGLPAFHAITADDVRTERVLFQSSKTFSDPSQVIGRYTLAAISPDTPLREDQLFNAGLNEELKGRYILSIPLKAAPTGSNLKPGAHISLLFSIQKPDEKNQSSIVIPNIILLAVERKGDAANIVIAGTEIEKIAPLLPLYDILIIESIQ